MTKGRVAVILATAVKGGRAGLALDSQPASKEVRASWLQLWAGGREGEEFRAGFGNDLVAYKRQICAALALESTSQRHTQKG